MVCIRLLPPLNYSNYITYYNPCQDFLALINNEYRGAENGDGKARRGGSGIGRTRIPATEPAGGPKAAREGDGSDRLRNSEKAGPERGRGDAWNTRENGTVPATIQLIIC